MAIYLVRHAHKRCPHLFASCVIPQLKHEGWVTITGTGLRLPADIEIGGETPDICRVKCAILIYWHGFITELFDYLCSKPWFC